MRRLPNTAPRLAAASFLILFAAAAGLSGCSTKPTFPGEQISDSVVKVAKDLYKLDVEVHLNERTLGVQWTGEALLDEAGKSLSKEVNEVIGNLSSVVSRVALSTDRPIDFIVVAARGVKESMELRIVRRMDDIRRAQAEALPMGESMNRTLFLQTPFDPAKLEEFDTHHWTLEEFLAKQMLQRVRISKPSDPANPIPSELYDGKFLIDEKDHRIFEFSVLAFKQENARENVLTVLRMVRDVLMAYRYDEFDQVIIRDLISNQRLVIGKSTMKIFEAKKITEDELLSTRMVKDSTQPNAFKNALEVFGFSIS